MTPPLSPPLAVHHYFSTHHQPHNIGASVHSVGGSSVLHRGDEPAALARTLDPGRKYCVGSGFNGEVGGCGVGNGGCDGGGGGGSGCCGGGVAAVTFSVGTTQEQQQGKQQHVRTERPPRPPSIESTVSVEGGGSDSSREASSYVWRVLVYLAFVNPFLCFLNSLYATFILLAGVITYPMRYFLLPKDHSYTTTPGLAYLLLVHLRFIHPQSTRSQHHSILPLPEDFDPARLVIVHLFGPFLAITLAVVASILVFIWIYTEVVLGEKNEGRGPEYRGVMFVRQRWEEYILIALKPKSLDSY